MSGIHKLNKQFVTNILLIWNIYLTDRRGGGADPGLDVTEDGV